MLLNSGCTYILESTSKNYQLYQLLIPSYYSFCNLTTYKDKLKYNPSLMKVPMEIGYLQEMQNNYEKKELKQGHLLSRSTLRCLLLLFILLSSIANLNTDFTNKLTYILSKKKKKDMILVIYSKLFFFLSRRWQEKPMQ